ncbi:multiubiquitin domain-containing protein [Mesorhizobium sp. VK22B]|uniref:Multiubiquitin domain-containing protein n=1 Tax=Mesorhizobium captivum TaxID=3072319 RepID=A0ABU4Z4Q2_9HYPH|nr:multiubiquitin domain-containing protein [Mesorhizobium sp. VK22B]MDX8494190.1 multiubiquitin domain-containing protein [Mesorhizobium sp. VK22B]
MTQAEKHLVDFIEVADVDLVFRAVTVSDRTLTGHQILAYADVAPREEHVVLRWLSGGDIEEIRPDEIVQISPSAPARFIVSKSDRLFRLVLDDRSIVWPKRDINEAALRQLGQIDAHAELYLTREKGSDQLISKDQDVSLAEAGVENIYSKEPIWKLNVQGVMIKSNDPVITVRRALIDAGFDPAQEWIIILKTVDSKRPVTLDDLIDLRAPGIEKLRLTPKDVNNGEVAAKRDFKLLPADEKGLAARELVWETVIEGGHQWLVIQSYPVPMGYNHSAVTMALEVPSSYPAAEIDMFYCSPHLERTNGRPIPQTQANATIGGTSFQRWSRHRGPASRWKPGLDNVLSHLALVDSALLQEVDG